MRYRPNPSERERNNQQLKVSSGMCNKDVWPGVCARVSKAAWRRSALAANVSKRRAASATAFSPALGLNGEGLLSLARRKTPPTPPPPPRGLMRSAADKFALAPVHATNTIFPSFLITLAF